MALTLDDLYNLAKAEEIKLEALNKEVLETMGFIQDVMQMISPENPMREQITDPDAFAVEQLPLYVALLAKIEIAADVLGTDN